MMSLRNSHVYSAPVPKMPPGLMQLMEGLTRDILKNNPTDVYAFCAEHMWKLLEIRDGATKKKVLTLEEKINRATKKIGERAAQRREDYDIKMKLLQYVHSDENYDEVVIGENDEAEQYLKENIVKIPSNDLTGNIEHEITVKFDETPPKIIDTTETQFENILDKETEDFHAISPKLGHTPNDHVIIELEKDRGRNENSKLCESIETKNEITFKVENVLEQTANIKEKSNVDKVEEKFDSNIRNEGQDTIDNSEHSKEKRNSDEHEHGKNDHDLSQNNDGIDNVENNEVDFNKLKYNIIEITQDDKEITITTTNFVRDDALGYQSNSEEKNCQITESANESNGENIRTIDQHQDKEHKVNQGELHSQINNNSMDLETAAITIQKVFRSFLFRNKTSSIDDVTNVDMNLLMEEKENNSEENKSGDIVSNSIINKDRRALGINRMDTVLQTVNEEKSLSLSTDDSSTLSSAATIIQAHVRGFLVRNKFNINKTISSTSGIDSDAQSMTSLEGDNDYRKNKTVLNIHIVPEGGHFMSRDETMLTSMDLSLDGSPPSSTNLHPLAYDISARRKLLKREDAIQSISPPSNNSGKLSEDVDSIKEILINGNDENLRADHKKSSDGYSFVKDVSSTNALNDDNISTMINNVELVVLNKERDDPNNKTALYSQISSDELDVVTPFVPLEETVTSEYEQTIKLMHSGECHDVVLPTKVSRNDTSVVRGDALIWYRSVCLDIDDWASLEKELLEEFLPFDYDEKLLLEIRRRTQGRDESSSMFIASSRTCWCIFYFGIIHKSRNYRNI